MEKNKEILLSLTSIFRIVFDDKNIKLDKNTSADDIEEWDSLSQIKIILACEKNFLLDLIQEK